MARRNFPVYDFAVYGIKTMLENIRLFILAMLAFFASMIAALFATSIIAWPVIAKLMTFKDAYKQEFMTCTSKAECLSVFRSMWTDVLVPLFYTHKVLLIACSLVFIILMAGFGAGLIRITLDLYDKKKSHVRKLFSCFGYVPRLLVAGIIVGSAILLGFTLFVIPGIYLAMRLFFFKFYIIDKDAGVIECMRKSFRATRGLEWEILGIVIVAGVFFAITPFIGLPVGALMSVAAYRKVQK